MEISLVERDAYYVCGFCVATTAAQNDSDMHISNVIPKMVAAVMSSGFRW